jgi:hypothetical protein
VDLIEEPSFTTIRQRLIFVAGLRGRVKQSIEKLHSLDRGQHVWKVMTVLLLKGLRPYRDIKVN